MHPNGTAPSIPIVSPQMPGEWGMPQRNFLLFQGIPRQLLEFCDPQLQFRPCEIFGISMKLGEVFFRIAGDPRWLLIVLVWLKIRIFRLFPQVTSLRPVKHVDEGLAEFRVILCDDNDLILFLCDLPGSYPLISRDYMRTNISIEPAAGAINTLSVGQDLVPLILHVRRSYTCMWGPHLLKLLKDSFHTRDREILQALEPKFYPEDLLDIGRIEFQFVLKDQEEYFHFFLCEPVVRENVSRMCGSIGRSFHAVRVSALLAAWGAFRKPQIWSAPRNPIDCYERQIERFDVSGETIEGTRHIFKHSPEGVGGRTLAYCAFQTYFFCWDM